MGKHRYRGKPSNAVDYQGNIIFGDVEGFVHVIDGSNGNTIGRMKISSNPIKNLVKRGNEIYILTLNNFCNQS